MKNYFLFLVFALHSITLCAQHSISPSRIFGEVKTVDNKTFKGYLTWGEHKNYWIDFFEAVKIENPYGRYFHPSDGVVFMSNGQSFAKPQAHIFCCRFGNIQHIRPIAPQEVLLTFKNGQEYRVRKGSTHDIGNTLKMSTRDEVVYIEWEFISEVTFQAPDETDHFPLHPVYGILKSSQGLYKGLIEWNAGSKSHSGKKESIDRILNKLQKVVREKSSLKAIPAPGNPQEIGTWQTDILYPVTQISVNMPNIGSVCVPWEHFESLEIIGADDLSLSTYADFAAPEKLNGEIIARTDQRVTGTFAYDLDETFDFEILEGKNDNILYKIPFKYIRSIEPKNYKYSFITLTDGSQLSLGDTCDVDMENNGMLVFPENEVAIYIPWPEIKKIMLTD